MSNPERINIHELTIEEPEKQGELHFDVERDIFEEDWKQMKKQLKEFARGKFWADFAHRTMQMKILNPGLKLGLDQQAWQGARDRL